MVDETDTEEATPVCLRCLNPYAPLAHYCSQCGTVVGQCAPYMPYVNIPFSYSIFERFWHTIWHDGSAPIAKKAFYWILIVAFAPVMLVGIPFMLWDRRQSRAKPLAT